MRKLFLLLIVIFLLSSCAHRIVPQGEYWFQALGEEGEYVLTADMERIRKGDGGDIIPSSAATGSVMDRAQRLSLSLVADAGDDTYPLPLSSFTVSGALEGRFPSFVVNSALKFSGMERVKRAGLVWYESAGMALASPGKDIVLFTDGSYRELYSRTVTERGKLIDDRTAGEMASALFSLYVFRPETLVDIGFEIPKTVLEEIRSTLLLFDSRDGSVEMGGRLETGSDGSARALTTLLKSQLVQDKRRKGEKLDISALASIFSTSGSTVVVDGYPISGEMEEKVKMLVKEASGGLF